MENEPQWEDTMDIPLLRERSAKKKSKNVSNRAGKSRVRRMSLAKRMHLTGVQVEFYFMIVLGLICILIMYFSIGFGTGLFSTIHSAVNATLNPQRPSRYQHATVPPVIHFVWTNQKQAGFTFTHALSIISAANNIEPEAVYLWFIREPKGIWWNLVLRRAPGVTLKYLPPSARNTGFKIDEHSKVIKLDKLIEHGGIYVDFNVIILRPLDSLMDFTTVLGHEERDKLSEYFILASKRSQFVRMWRKKYEKVRKAADISIKDFGFIEQLAKIFPRLLYAEPDRILRPYKSEMNSLKKNNWDWRSFYAMNIWTEDMDLRDLTPKDIDCMDSALGQVLRIVYYGSEKLRKCSLPEEFE